MRLIRWLAWWAADVTAWGVEQGLWPYAVYNQTCLFAFSITPEGE